MVTTRAIHSLSLAAFVAGLTATAALAARADRNCYEDIGCPWKTTAPLSQLRKLSCQNLAHVRNHTYYENCFHTAAAKASYGNVGCKYPISGLVPLNSFERTDISRIRQVEAEKSCHH